MNDSTCKTCTHYHQHYIIDEQGCAAINCGHCTYPQIKHREPGTRAWQHYEQRAAAPALPDRKGVVHFLTTEFLQYILSLELPPEEISGEKF